MTTTGTPMMWAIFALFVTAALVVDFVSLRKQGAHEVHLREATIWSIIWIAVSMVFMGWLWWYLGGTSGDAAREALAGDKTLEYLTGYLVEKALAVDNIFV